MEKETCSNITKNSLTIIVAFLLSASAFCEDVKVIEPEVKDILNLSVFEGKDIITEIRKAWDGDKTADDKVVSESNKIGRNGCSWYCGGKVATITASSNLPIQENITYLPMNVHDFDIRTAWVVNKNNYGIGEYIEYHFDADTPRPTKVQILNGYMKNEKLWKENSRVKQLKLYLNDKLIAKLNLQDNTGVQKYFIGTPFESKIHPAYKLKFEIADVYKGEKYSDTAISELTFEGIDVH